MNALVFTESETLLCASIAHTLNELWRKAHGEYAQGAWHTLPPERQDRAINGVNKCLELYNAGHTDVDEMSSLMHDNWVAYMEGNGWVYGETQDETLKTHPCMVSLDQLPDFQKHKDTFIPTAVHLVASYRQ